MADQAQVEAQDEPFIPETIGHAQNLAKPAPRTGCSLQVSSRAPETGT